MEYWKRAIVAGGAALGTIMLLKGKKTGALMCGGVSLAVLAAEYPDKFAEVQTKMQHYIDQGTAYLDVVSGTGKRLAKVERRGARWLENLLAG